MAGIVGTHLVAQVGFIVKDIEETKSEIVNRPNPEILIPRLAFRTHDDTSLSVMTMLPAGHVRSHCPQPTQISKSTLAKQP